MDPRHTGDMLKHLEKQNELLMEAYRSMSHELHKLQVEEEMLMRKFYEIMSAHGKIKKTLDAVNLGRNVLMQTGKDDLIKLLLDIKRVEIEDRGNISDYGKVGDSTALVTTTSNEEQ